MDYAFRTNTSVIELLAGAVTKEEINAFVAKKQLFKKSLKSVVIPTSGIIRGNTLKDSYFPSTLLNGINYDVFISHSHNNEPEAHMLATWLEKSKGLTCFVDSFAWGSADQLLKEIDDKYCVKQRNRSGNSYYYHKRNFTTSHVHAILSMALLDTIIHSRYCIFIDSSESVHLTGRLKKETLSPWLYEEIKFMQLLQPRREIGMFSEGLEKAINSCNISYDVSSELNEFPFLDVDCFNSLCQKLEENNFGLILG